METICSGIVDLAEGSITGLVQQLVHGDDGWTYPADEATHTYRLVVDTHDGVSPAQRMAHAHACTAFVTSLELPPMLRGISVVPVQAMIMPGVPGLAEMCQAEWQTLFHHAVNMGESTSAVIRWAQHTMHAHAHARP